MEIKEAATKLAEAPHHLVNPSFGFLVPNEQTYSILFHQPQARVVATTAGIGHADRPGAVQECIAFLRKAADLDVDVGLLPEYCCPWAAIEQAVREDVLPRAGRLWVLGCESITPPELDEFRARSADVCKVLYDMPAANGRTFLDPVAYVFRTSDQAGNQVTVVLVQFKTQAMADAATRLEPDNLIPGQYVYRFKNPGEQSISLLSLLCSDSLGLIAAQNHEALGAIGEMTPLVVFHLQLNLKPRDTIYTSYRFKLLQEQKQREILCANWASGTAIAEGGTEYVIKDPMSAIYLQSMELKCDEEWFAANHRRGAYPTYLGSCRAIAYVLNFHSQLFYLRSTKASQIMGPAQARARTGPEMIELFEYGLNGQWTVTTPAVDKCDVCFANCDPALVVEGRARPLDTERLILLSTGKVVELAETPSERRWPQIEAMESCRLGPGEAIQRLTFAQDSTPKAMEYRELLINRYRVFSQERQQQANYPVWVDDFKANASLAYDPRFPFVNLHIEERHAFAAYVGGDLTEDAALLGVLHRYIHNRLSSAAWGDPDKIVIWYRDLAGKLRHYPSDLPIRASRKDPPSTVGITNG